LHKTSHKPYFTIVCIRSGDIGSLTLHVVSLLRYQQYVLTIDPLPIDLEIVIIYFNF